MAERNVILRLESVVAGSVGRAFKTVTTNVDEIQKEFDQAKLAVSETTREMKRLQREGKDISDVERRLEEAQRATKRWREELQTARARLDRVAQAGKRLDAVAGALNKVNIASGIFTAALGFGLNEINQQILEMGEAVNRAGLQFDEGSRLILAAQKAGSRDASGFVEELKEIPRALQEAYESQEKLNALQQLGLDPDRLLGLDRVSQFEAILDAVRNTSLDSRQYLLETAGLTGLFADQMLQFANLSESAFQQFRADLRSGRAVTLEQYQAQQEFNASIAEFRQELLLGGIEILKTYLPAIKAIIGAMTEGVGWVLEFIAQNKELVIVLGSAAVSIATVTLAIKAARTAVLLFAGAQKALAAASVIGWTNPFLAAIAAIGIALAGVIWLLSRFKKTTEEVNRTQLETPDFTAGIDRGRVNAATDRYRRQAQREVDALQLEARRADEPPPTRLDRVAQAQLTVGDLHVRRAVIDDVQFAGAPAAPAALPTAPPTAHRNGGGQTVGDLHVRRAVIDDVQFAGAPAAPAALPTAPPTAHRNGGGQTVGDLHVRRAVIDDVQFLRQLAAGAPAAPPAAPPTAPPTAHRNGGGQTVNNIHIEVVVHGADQDVATAVGDRLAAELQTAIDAGIWGRNG